MSAGKKESGSKTFFLEQFDRAYSIEGKGVGKLQLEKAAKSDSFKKKTKTLVKEIQRFSKGLKG